MKKFLLALAILAGGFTAASAQTIIEPGTKVMLPFVCTAPIHADTLYSLTITDWPDLEPIKPVNFPSCNFAPPGRFFQGVVVEILNRFDVAEGTLMLVAVQDARSKEDRQVYFAVVIELNVES